MIDAGEMGRIAAGYPPDGIRVGVMGSHSALEVMDGAVDEGLGTVVMCERGREGPYERLSRIAGEVVVLDSFSDMASPEVQEMLLRTGTILVPHRSLAAYLGYDAIEERLAVPMFGNRALLRAEERAEGRNQYGMLRSAGIRHPRLYSDPSEIDGPAIVKAMERERGLERAFFVVTSAADYEAKAAERLERGLVSEEGLRAAAIEEYAVGTYMNFNYFWSPVSDRVDFLGIERRLQTNVDDYASMPARQQLDMDVQLQNIEVGHTPASIRESLLGKVFEMGDAFAGAAARDSPPGVVGPFSLQSVITRDLEVVVYDVSLRVPGNPILATTTPYTKYQYGRTFGVGARIAMEVKRAAREGRLAGVVT